MITASIFNDPEFARKLKRQLSAHFDTLVEQVIADVDKSFLDTAASLPDEQMLYTMNIARVSCKSILSNFLTKSHTFTEDQSDDD